MRPSPTKRQRVPGAVSAALAFQMLVLQMLVLQNSGSSAGGADSGAPPLLDAAALDAMFVAAEREGRVGRARKVKPVDARPAVPGEIVVTVIKGEGVETTSPPAKAGDMVVRNRCPETGNEEILVAAAKFPDRYEGPIGDADADAATAPWRTYRPRGAEMAYFLVSSSEGPFTFMAPWGEAMTARPGDAIVRDPRDPADTYRIARAAFACTYDVVGGPRWDR